MIKVVPHAFQSHSRYDDVWSRETEICPYCAYELADEDERCPHCANPLVSWHFRYEQPGTNLHILWVVLAGLGQLYLIAGILDIVVGTGLPLLLFHGLLTPIFFILAIAVYFRQSWAHTSAIVILLLLLFLRVIESTAIGATFLPQSADPLEALFINPLLSFALDAVDVLQLAAAALALLWAILLTGPDFERKKTSHRARLGKQYREPASFYVAGREHARRGEWATAILHWQRAVASAPGNRHYHRHLGQAYARLGFFDRSYGALQTAHELTLDPAEKQQLAQQLAKVEQHLATADLDEKHDQ